METIRAFIAVQIPGEVKSKFEEVQGRLRASGADVRWVKPRSAHITLQFLGDTPLDKIEEIKSALARIASRHIAFDVSVEGLGVFPNPTRPRVVWIGIHKGANSLAALQSSVSAEMRRLGLETVGGAVSSDDTPPVAGLQQRQYSPHITLGRVKSQKNLESLRSLLENEREFRAGEFPAAQIHLIRSILSSEGPTYSTLFSAPLAAGAS